MKEEARHPSRREFIGRVTKAGVSLAAAGGLACWLYDTSPPRPGPAARTINTLDYSVPPQTGRTLCVVKGSDRKETVNKAIDLLGGIERFIKPGEVVLIKPNVAFASAPSLGATAHPDLVAEVAGLCLRRAGAKEVIVADNPINDPASCFRLTRIGSAAADAGANVLLPTEALFEAVTLESAALIRQWPVFLGPLRRADKVIGIAPVKDHHRSGASMTMKNFYGLLGGRRNIFHQDINTIIAELALLVKPTFVVLDGTQAMMTNGPTGGSLADLKRCDTMIVSCDHVAADTYGAQLLGLKPTDLPYLAKAENAGAGTTDYRSLSPIEAEIAG